MQPVHLYSTKRNRVCAGSAEKRKDIFITRWGNPTFTEAENKIAALESFGLKDKSGNPLQLKAYLHASGMAAITTLMIHEPESG
ncbi:MAG: hypothetical protein WDO19_23730 [Bacteroidota bacterium]